MTNYGTALNLIDGAWQPAASGAAGDSINPAGGACFGSYADSARDARALRNGTVWINDHNRLFAEAETGGYRRSGIGRLHGYEGLADFLETKHIFRNAGVL